jgi:aldose sugar dehydrogenase
VIAVIRTSLACCLLAFEVHGTARASGGDASSARQNAVQIDRVEVPSMEPAILERVASHLRFPWSLAFVPNGDLLITEKHHGVRLHAQGRLSPDVIPGGPENVLAKGDSGLLDIVIDPDFKDTRRVFIEPRKPKDRLAPKSWACSA